MNTIQQILKNALDLLEDGEAWTQGQATRATEGGMKYCAVGAVTCVEEINTVNGFMHVKDAMVCLDEAAMEEGVPFSNLSTRPAATLNDKAKDFSEVRGMFKRAFDIAGETQCD
jgi:hypothetical protein